MPGLAIIANPNAHRNRNWPLASQALVKAAPAAAFYETRTQAELEEAAKPLALLGGGAYDSLAPLGGPGAAEDRLRRLAEAVATGAPLRTTERDTIRVA